MVRKKAGKRAKVAGKKPRKGALISLPGARVAEVLEISPLQVRVVDSLRLMLRNGSINAAMHDAGQAFACDFACAQLDGQVAMRLEGEAEGGARGGSTERAVMARQRVHRALDAVGGMESLGGAVLWDVCGLGMTVSQWAANRQTNHSVAKGVLVAALDIVARVYSYV